MSEVMIYLFGIFLLFLDAKFAWKNLHRTMFKNNLFLLTFSSKEVFD